jgi:transcriptional regulator GlxA family with amidase domain
MKFCVYLYPGMEPIDLATFGVLSMAQRIEPSIAISTLAAKAGAVTLANDLKVVADHGFANPPDYDVLIVGGGPGWVEEAKRPATLAFLRATAQQRDMVSVCTGGMILAAAGVLDGLPATTKSATVPPEVSPLDVMRKRHPAIRVERASLVDSGRVITGGGVTLCIDTMLYLLGKYFGERVAVETARTIEYTRAWDANRAALPVVNQRQTQGERR